jgi:hypothetical protein
MQDMLEAVTGRGVQDGRDGLRPIRLLLQSLHAPCVKGMDDVTDGLDGTAHKLRNGLRRQPTGTGEDDLGPPDTEGIGSASVGFQLLAFFIGQGSNKEWWFHSSSIPLETLLDKNSCGDALGIAESHCPRLPGSSARPLEAMMQRGPFNKSVAFELIGWKIASQKHSHSLKNGEADSEECESISQRENRR